MAGATSTNTGAIASISMFGNSNSIEDSVKLYGKDDIFNYELSPH
jgi:hypothetical protein